MAVVAERLPGTVLHESAQGAWKAMLSAINGARSTIHLESYAFSDQGIGARFIAALNGAAARGVAVEVVVDGWGALWSAARVVQLLRNGGCDARVHNRLRASLFGKTLRNHRKLLVVDGNVAFIGGINIGDAFADWGDLALELHGPPARALSRRLAGEHFIRQEGPVRIHLSRAGGGWRLRRMYTKAFATARHSVLLAQAYFLPDAKLLRRLLAAAKRGVSVTMLLAGRSDVPLAHLASSSFEARLQAGGARVVEWRRSILHAKVAVIDGRRLLLGSFNLDPFSLADLEALAIVDDPRIARQAERWIERRVSEGESISPESSDSPLLALAGRIVVGIVRLLAWLLR
jgi:cardiolipin synthase